MTAGGPGTRPATARQARNAARDCPGGAPARPRGHPQAHMAWTTAERALVVIVDQSGGPAAGQGLKPARCPSRHGAGRGLAVRRPGGGPGPEASKPEVPVACGPGPVQLQPTCRGRPIQGCCKRLLFATALLNHDCSGFPRPHYKSAAVSLNEAPPQNGQ